MRAFRILNIAMFSCLVASTAILYAQDPKQEEEKPRQEEPKRQEAPKAQEPRPEGKQDEMKAPRQEEAKPPKQEKQEQRQQEQRPEEKQSHEQMRPGQPEPMHQGNARAERKSAHIPDDKFRQQFGRSHTFVVRRPVMVEDSPGFFYGGYSFVLVDVWPTDWDYNDDCYVDYIDGEYFLFDLRHPGVRIALMVVM